MTERKTFPRSTCCIMGCARWSKSREHEWICGDHWKIVPLRSRRFLKEIWKRINALPDTREGFLAYRRLARIEGRAWEREKRRVTLHCAGI